MDSHTPTPPHLLPEVIPQPTDRRSTFEQAKFNGNKRARRSSGSADPSATAPVPKKGKEWLGMGGYKHHMRLPTDQLSDYSSSHNSPYRETLGSYEFDSPLLDPSFADSLELDRFRLDDDGDFAPPENSSSPPYGSLTSPILPQQPGEPPNNVTENVSIAAKNPGVLEPHWHQSVPTSASNGPVVQDQRRTFPLLEAWGRQRQRYVSSDTSTLRHTPADTASPVVRERELKRWDGGLEQTHEDTTLESAGRFTGTGWDQFAVNEQTFGVRTTYNEDDYTTPIKRNDPKYRDRAAKAERIIRMAWEVENAAPAKTAKVFGGAFDAGELAIFATDLGSTLRGFQLKEGVSGKELGEVVWQIQTVVVSLQRIRMLQEFGSAKAIGSEKLLEDLGAVLNSCHWVLCQIDTHLNRCEADFPSWKHKPLWFDVDSLRRFGELIHGHHKALDLIASVMQMVQGRRTNTNDEFTELKDSLRSLGISSKMFPASDETAVDAMAVGSRNHGDVQGVKKYRGRVESSTAFDSTEDHAWPMPSATLNQSRSELNRTTSGETTTDLGSSSSGGFDPDRAELCDDGDGVDATSAVARSPCVAESTNSTPSRINTPSESVALVNHEQIGSDDRLTTAELFAEAEAYLKRLEDGILSLEEASDSASGVDGSDSDVTVHEDLQAQTVDSLRERSEAKDDDHEDPAENDISDGTDSRTSSLPMQETEGSDASQHHKRQKRKQPTGSDGGHARTRVALADKRSKLTYKRFICCFQNGPGRRCSGTDETISEVIKKLSDWHDTHICDRCWVRKVNDETSGAFVHPEPGEACHDYCLSPQCHDTSPRIGHRHRFDPNICGTKTSRVRPGDSEAVYRFIFQLVHPALEAPESVFTDEYKLHLDAVPRQCRRKPNSEELRVIAADLRKKLEELGKQQHAKDEQTRRMERELADANGRDERERERVASLEARTRRIVAMLGDALRTGIFPDQAGHASLLARVEEDAPSALSYRTQPLLTPSASDGSQRSSTTPAMGGPAIATDQSCMSQAAASQDLSHGSSLPASCEETFDDFLSQGLEDQGMSFDWTDPFDQPGGASIMPGA